VLEAFKKKFPDRFILLSFFSPSGYEVRKNYPLANYVCYLPLDTKRNARHFIRTARPKMVIFVKYEFWLHYLSALHREKIPLLLISAIFRKEQFFFRWYGKSFKRLLHYYDQLFVQDKTSAALLKNEGAARITISGDTRFDRVASIAEKAQIIPGIAGFLQGKKAWVAGSTWAKDEEIIAGGMDKIPKWIIAPHEINEEHLVQIEQQFAGKTVRYSHLKTDPERYAAKQVLLIDNIGMLSSLYQYGVVAYVGGGFGKGIHNGLEAAIWGIPVVFGPVFQKFKEARDLVGHQAAFSIRDRATFSATVAALEDTETRLKAGITAAGYVRARTGATATIMAYIMQPENAS
jgi:3-deoxy-D-manno-octulosonic-acid transferase